jgi:ligand-binding sensor domain-containing protein
VGTATGLHKFDPRTGRVLQRYAATPNDPNTLHGKYVQATVEDEEGVLWAGTTAGGLNRLDPKEETFSYYTADAAEPRRIANNFIYRLAQSQPPAEPGV